MTVRHHPLDETLAAYAIASLDFGQRVAVASHVERCEACRRFVRRFGEFGGAMLDNLQPAPMTADAMSATLARLDDAGQVWPAPAVTNNEPGLPAVLKSRKLGPWRWVGIGVQMRAIELPRPGGSRAFLLKGNPGTQLPQHTHTGSEMTAILAGSYEHEGGQFAAGDFEDADDSIVHRPIVGPEGCVCLVALNGRLRLTGVVGALLNPFVRL